jgi:hypothetical protein
MSMEEADLREVEGVDTQKFDITSREREAATLERKL